MTAFSERLKNAKEFFTNLLTETSPFDRLSEHANNSQDVVKLLPMLDLKDKTSGRISKFPRPAGGNLKGFKSKNTGSLRGKRQQLYQDNDEQIVKGRKR